MEKEIYKRNVDICQHCEYFDLPEWNEGNSDKYATCNLEWEGMYFSITHRESFEKENIAKQCPMEMEYMLFNWNRKKDVQEN